MPLSKEQGEAIRALRDESVLLSREARHLERAARHLEQAVHAFDQALREGRCADLGPLLVASGRVEERLEASRGAWEGIVEARRLLYVVGMSRLRPLQGHRVIRLGPRPRG